MNAVFVDSSYYIALLNGDDEFHETAIQVTAAHSRQSVTTAWVLTEVADAFSRPAFPRLAVDFIRELQHDTRITVVPPTAELFERALDLFSQRPDKHWSLTDCVSFVVMQHESITEALSADQHFQQAGFRALMLEHRT